jgi:hypothetical protein
MFRPPLLAGGFDAWAEVIFFLVMGFLWLINRISAMVETARRPPPVRRPPMQPVPPADGPPQQVPQMPPGQRVAAPAQPRTAAESLQNEIDEFLRRATGRQQSPQQFGQPQQPGQMSRQRPAGQRPTITVSRSDPRRGKPTTVVVRTKPSAQAPTEPLETPEAISEHVKQYLDTRSFEQRSSHLSSIDEKERQFDQQIQQTFGHGLGHLKPSALSTGGDSNVSAAAFQQSPAVAINPLIRGLQNPVDIRKAIVLNEILQRPEGRWS